MPRRKKEQKKRESKMDALSRDYQTKKYFMAFNKRKILLKCNDGVWREF